MTTFKEIPIWAYIEFLTLGDFILLLKNCNTSVKNGINLKFDLGLNNEILTNVLKPIKDIRNNIAHNQPIFDVRFNDTKYNERDITQLILSKNNIKDQTSFSFNDSHITDYIILIYTLAKHIFVDDEEEYMLSLKKLLSDIRDGNLKLSNKIIISKIFGDNYQDKISLFI
jgi:abortive infection bacteriophage resistance protein